VSKKSKAAKKEKAAQAAVIEWLGAPVAIPPRLYKPIEDLCRDALHYSDNAVGMRETIRKLAFAMRAAVSDASGGSASIDVLALEALLNRTDPNQRELPFNRTERPRDPVEELFKQHHLDSDQYASAMLLRDVWNAWGRHLLVVGHGFDGEGGGARTLKDPLTSMGQAQWDIWRSVYTPWYENAKKVTVVSKSRGTIRVTSLVLAIVTESTFPGALDQILKLERGTCLRVLKEQLTELSKLKERGALPDHV
jgi:hypothetical protein